MKTIFDAVNEFKGITIVSCYMENKSQIVMAKKPFYDYLTGDLSTGDGVRDNEYWEVICTRDQYNTLVDEMLTNFGTSETYSDYKVNYEMINEAKVTPPVFTQKMAGAGEFPSVGMKVMIDANFSDVDGQSFSSRVEDEVLGFINGKGIFKDHTTTLDCVVVVDNMYPLTPPITLDKGKAYQFDYDGVEYIGVAIKGLLLIVHASGSVFNAHPKDCTNIKLLEVTS